VAFGTRPQRPLTYWVHLGGDRAEKKKKTGGRFAGTVPPRQKVVRAKGFFFGGFCRTSRILRKGGKKPGIRRKLLVRASVPTTTGLGAGRGGGGPLLVWAPRCLLRCGQGARLTILMDPFWPGGKGHFWMGVWVEPKGPNGGRIDWRLGALPCEPGDGGLVGLFAISFDFFWGRNR